MWAYRLLWFQWLLNMWAGDFIKPSSEVWACKNFFEDEVWVLKRVPWTSYIDVDTELEWSVNFLHSYYQPSTSVSRMISWSDSWSNYLLKQRTNWNWWALTWTDEWLYTWADWAELSSVNYLDKTFIVWYYWTSFVDPATIYWTIHTTSSSSDSDLLNMPSGKYIIRYRDLLYVMNTPEWSNSWPSTAIYSDNPINWAITWSNLDETFLEFGQDDWDFITWWEESWDKLIVFKNNSTWYWDESYKKKISDIWCEAPKSIQKINGIVYFVNRHWLYRYWGELPQLISQKIQPFIDNIDWSKPLEIVSAKHWLEYRLFIWTVKVKWDTYTNTWIVFDTRREKYYIRCTNDIAYTSCEYIEWDNSLKRSYFWTDSWNVVKFNTVIDWVNTDTWEEIDYFFKTNILDLWNPEVVKHAPKITVFSQNPNGMKYCIDSDRSWEFWWDNDQILDANVFTKDINSEFNRIQIKFYWKWWATPPSIEWFVIESNDIENWVFL